MKLRSKIVSCILSVGMMMSVLPSMVMANEDIDKGFVHDNARQLNYGTYEVSYGTTREFWMYFIPKATGYYELISYTESDAADPEVSVYDSNFNIVRGTDLREGSLNFDILNTYNQGSTYYVRINAISSAESGSFKIQFFPSVADTANESFYIGSSGSATLDCTATQSHSDHPEYYHYQWFDANHNSIDNATSAIYRPSTIGDYYCSYSFYTCIPIERKFHVAEAVNTEDPSDEEDIDPVAPVESEDPEEDSAANNGSATSASTPYISSNSEPGVAGFVERLYTVALGRASDPTGKQDWIDAITLRGTTGADAARGFLYSPEFLDKACSNEDFTTVLYRTFFDRDPDQAGFDAWVAALNNGASKQDVIEGFINSTEWANLCLRYGIASGGAGQPSTEVEPNEATIDFATRLYTTCLNRDADASGLMAWARQLANQRDSGTGAARGFFFSQEFLDQNVDNSEYVNRLYLTFMGREADEAGFTAWVGQLDSGVSREEVFNGFAASTEFSQICASYGIIR